MYPVYLITCHHPSYGPHIRSYVGVVLTAGKTVEERFREHHQTQTCPYLSNALKKHGKEHFVVQQIDAGNTPEQALELEKFYIKRLGTKAPGGYNLTHGGDGIPGFVFSEESRRRISIANRARGKPSESTRRKMSASHMGKTNPLGLSDETRRKISEAHRGQGHSESTRLKMSASIRAALAARRNLCLNV